MTIRVEGQKSQKKSTKGYRDPNFIVRGDQEDLAILRVALIQHPKFRKKGSHASGEGQYWDDTFLEEGRIEFYCYSSGITMLVNTLYRCLDCIFDVEIRGDEFDQSEFNWCIRKKQKI